MYDLALSNFTFSNVLLCLFFFFLMHEQNLTILQAFLCVFGFTSVAGPRGRHLLLLEGIASAAGGNRHLALDALVLG